MKLVRYFVSLGLGVSVITMANADNNVPADSNDNFDCLVKGITECSIPSSIEDFKECLAKVFAACSEQPD